MGISKVIYTFIGFSCFFISSNAQTTTTVVPFLNIIPDARTAAMGEAGMAVQPDANSISINPAKLARIPSKSGISASYSPWLKSLLPDMNLSYVSGYLQLDEQSAAGAGLRYFSAGKLQYRDTQAQYLQTVNPAEFAFEAAYSRNFGDSFSLGTAVRYVSSDLISPDDQAFETGRALKTIAVDASAFFTRPLRLFGTDARASAGLNISNIGPQLSASNNENKSYLPTTIRLGTAIQLDADVANQVTLALDVRQLLINEVADANLGALQRLSAGTGLEYSYNHAFFLRTGYTYENPGIGNHRYLSLGAGFKYNSIQFDTAYLVANMQKTPLANTLRFTLMFNFGEK